MLYFMMNEPIPYYHIKTAIPDWLGDENPVETSKWKEFVEGTDLSENLDLTDVVLTTAKSVDSPQVDFTDMDIRNLKNHVINLTDHQYKIPNLFTLYYN